MKKKELLSQLLDEIEEIKLILNDVAKSLIPQQPSTEGPQFLQEIEEPPVTEGFLDEVVKEDTDVFTEWDGK